MKTHLFEGISPIVYHATGIIDGFKILNSGAFRLSPSYQSEVENDITKKLFHLSTTRSRLGGYHLGKSSMVFFELDGRRISQRVSSIPVDYWGNLNPTSEMEDRIVSDKPLLSIDGIISGIEIVADDFALSSKAATKAIKYIYLYAKKNKIPIIVYRTTDALKKRDRRNVYSHAEIITFDAPEGYAYKSTNRDIKTFSLYHFVNAYYTPYTKLSSASRRQVNEIIRSPDSKRVIQGEIKSAHHLDHPQLTKLVYRVANMMKAEKVTTFNGLFNIIHQRVSDEIKLENKRERARIHQNIYNTDKAKFDHLIDVFNRETTFDPGVFGELPPHDLMSKIDSMSRTLRELDMLSDSIKLIWFDDYDLITDDAWRKLFNIEV